MSTASWPENFIKQKRPSNANVRALLNVVDQAKDERPIHSYLASTPSLLRTLLPGHCDAWCFDRLSFGSEWIPDFLLCCRNSAGIHWALVELESPIKPALTQRGRPAAKLVEALGQISDWRIWIRDNIAYARTQLKLKGISAESPAFVLIGRRSSLDPKHAARYRELSRDRVVVMTYDRLIESARGVHVEV